jgi:hypothetical protein
VPKDDEPPGAWGGLEQDAVPEKTYLDLKKAAQEDAAEQIQRLVEDAQEADKARPPPPVEASEVPRHADRIVQSAAKIIPIALGVSLLLATLWAVMPVFLAAQNRGARHTDLVERAADPTPPSVQPWLWVVTEPAGARIEIGGQELGTTPYGAPISGLSRQIRVRLSLEGYTPWTGEVRKDETGHYRLMVHLVAEDPAEVPVEAE